MSLKKIAIMCHASAGGSGVVATELALALAALGQEVHLIATERPFRLTDDRLAIAGGSGSAKVQSGFNQSLQRWFGRWLKRPESGGVHFHQIVGSDYPLFEEPLTPLAAANALAEVVTRHQIEVVHAHYAIPFATSALLAREMGFPIRVVTTLHGTDVTLLARDPAFAYTTRHAISSSDAVSAVSHALAQDTRQHLGAARTPEVIYNWVDPERFKPNPHPAHRARFAQPEEAILLHVSNFREVKRPMDVLRVFAKVLQARPARLLMVGQGPLRARCLELAEELNITGRVQFLEFTPHIERMMAVADVLLLPSEREAFGLVALEAMACGVPVVASNTGGLPEVVIEGQTGSLVPVGDTEGMAQAVLGLLQSPEQHRWMAQQARLRAVEHFSPQRILPQYLDLYQKTLQPPMALAL